MASPFRVFRKNQKVWMAALTIMAMFAFVVFTGPMMSGSRMGGRESAVVQTKFGNLTQSQVINLRNERKLLITYFDMLRRGLERSPEAQRRAKTVCDLLGPDTEDAAIERWVYARTAESMGIVVDNKSVNDFLNLLLNGVSDPQNVIKTVLQATPGGMNAEQFMLILSKQLLALRLMQVAHVTDNWAGVSATPGERWDYFKRMHQKASIEVAILLPSKLTGDVEDPSSDELKRFFENYKNGEPSPDSHEPGFLVPRRINIQYLLADEKKIENQITDAEVTNEYEKDPKKYARDLEDLQKEEKEERDARAKEEKEEAAAKAAAEKKTTPEAKKNETKPEPKPAKQEEKPTKPEEKSGMKPAVETKAETKSETPSSVKPQTTPETKAESKKTPEPAKPTTTGTKPSGTSSAAPTTPFRLVAYAADKPADTATPPAAGGKKDAATPAAPKPAEEKKSAAEKKLADEKKPVEEKKPTATTKKETKPSEDKKAGAEKPAETKPFESGRKEAAKTEERKPIKTAQQRLNDRIRRELALKRLDGYRAKIRTLLEDYRQKWVSAGPDEKPTPPDFAALAKEYSMTAGRTGLLSKAEMAETDFGQSVVENMETHWPVSVLDEIFGPTTLYKVGISYFGSQSKLVEYIFWKTDDQAGGVPNWDRDTENRVRDQWKLVKARKKAFEKAEKLMAEIGKGENAAKPLKDIVDAKQGIVVMQPPKFAWLTSFERGRPELSKVGDLTKPGNDFMKKVFDLSPGQVTVATNPPQTEVYVVRMKELTPFKELWEDFISPDMPQYYFPLLVSTEQAEVNRAWHNEVMKNAGYVDNRNEARKAAERQPAPRPEAPEGMPTPEEE